MKEATGELNMTVLVVIAIAAIAGLFYVFVWPMIQRTIAQQTCNVYGTGYKAVQFDGEECKSDNERVKCWKCCKGDDKNNCVEMTEDATG